MPRTPSNGKNASKQKDSNKEVHGAPATATEVTVAVEEGRNDTETINVSTKVWIVKNGNDTFKLLSEGDAMNKMRDLMTTGELGGNFSMNMFDDDDKATEYLQSVTRKQAPPANNQPTNNENLSSKMNSMFDGLPTLEVNKNPCSSGGKRSLASHPEEDPFEDDLIKRFKADMKRQGMQLVVHYFTTVPPSATTQPIIIDFQDSRSSFPHWLHRSKHWVFVIKYILTNARQLNIVDPFHDSLEKVTGRHPNGDDVPETRKSKTNGITLYRDMLVGFINPSFDKDDLHEALKTSLKPLVNNTKFQRIYQIEYCRGSRNANAQVLLSSNPESSDAGNNFWAMLDGALDNTIKMVPHSSLAELIITPDIRRIIHKVLGDTISHQDISTKNLTQQIRKFAFNE